MSRPRAHAVGRAAGFPVGHYFTRNIQEHVGLIQEQYNKSVRDAELRQLAVRLVSGRYEYRKHPVSGRSVPMLPAWGEWFYAPTRGKVCAPNDEECEIRAIWDFWQLNYRYVYDPNRIDFFATTKATLQAGGGDCDDATIGIGSMGAAIGFTAVARVISTTDAPEEWSHIYPMLGVCSKANPKKYVPMDITIEGSYPGWQYGGIADHIDFIL